MADVVVADLIARLKADTSQFKTGMTSADASAKKALGAIGTHAQHASTIVESAGKRMGSAISHVGSLAGQLGVPFAYEFGMIGQGFDKLSVKGETFAAKLASFGKTAALGIGAVAVALGVIGVKAALDEEKATARLETAVKNVHESYKALAPAIERVSNRLVKLGFQDTVTHSSLAMLIPAVKSTKGALDLMGLAANIARGRNISLEEATALLIKVQTGHVALLGRMGIEINKTVHSAADLAKAQLDVESAQAKLNDVTKKHGATSLEARTASNELALAQERLTTLQKDGTKETISSKEALQKLSDMYGGEAAKNAQTFSGKLEILKAQGDALAEKIGFFLIPKLEALGRVLMDGVKWLEDHSTAAKALAIVIGVVLVAAIGTWVVTTIRGLAEVTIAMLTNPYTALIAATLALVVLFATKWDEIKMIARDAVNELIRIYNAIPLLPNVGYIQDPGVRIPLPPGEVYGPTLPPGVAQVPNIYGPVPGTALGGTTVRPGLQWVGEQGKELLNMPRGASVIPLDRVGGGGTTVNVYVSGSVVTERQLVAAVIEGAAAAQARGASVPWQKAS